MARGLNSVHLAGTLTQAPEMKYTAGGLAILELNLGGNDHVVGSDGQARDLAWYHRVTVFGKQAEYLADQLEAGTPVFVDGRLNYRTWEDQNGQKRSALGINAIRVEAMQHGPRKEATVLDARGQERLTNALNQVTIIGNLIKDAELRYTPSGDAVTRFVVAVNEQYRDRNNQDQESVHFVEVNVWRELAEGCAELAKGDPVMVMGRLVTDNWTDKDGNRNYKDKLEGAHVEFLVGKPKEAVQSVQRAAPAEPESSPSCSATDSEFPPDAQLPF